jgi:hypothetical protein
VLSRSEPQEKAISELAGEEESHMKHILHKAFLTAKKPDFFK